MTLFALTPLSFVFGDAGMDELEFVEAACDMNDLIVEYQQMQDYPGENKMDDDDVDAEGCGF